MNKIILTGFCAIFTLFGYAQQNTVAGGGEASGSGGTVSFSVGQVDYINSTGSNGDVNQGVQQPFEFFKDLGIEEQSFGVSLYPNPTQESVILEFENLSVGYHYKLYDSNGKLLSNGGIMEEETIINMQDYPPAAYNLTIIDNNQNTQTIKIIKH